MDLGLENVNSDSSQEIKLKSTTITDRVSGVCYNNDEISIKNTKRTSNSNFNIKQTGFLKWFPVFVFMVTVNPNYINEAIYTPEGIGGPEVIFFADEFIHTDTNYICDENIYGIGYQGGSTRVQYSKNVSLGEVIEYDFRPGGEYASNVTFIRPDLYEIVLGDNDFTHITLKNLGLNSFIDLTTENTKQKRANLNRLLSTTTANTVHIEERFMSESESEMQLVLIINNQQFISDKIIIDNREKNKSISLGLLDLDKNKRNYTSVDFYDLRICN